MDFKSTLKQVDNKNTVVKIDKYYDWNTVNVMITDYVENSKVKQDDKNLDPLCEEKYNIMSSNDDVIYNETKYLKDKFYFKGLLLNTDMEKLINIYVKNMHIEEIIDENEEEDFYYEEEEIIL